MSNWILHNGHIVPVGSQIVISRRPHETCFSLASIRLCFTEMLASLWCIIVNDVVCLRNNNVKCIPRIGKSGCIGFVGKEAIRSITCLVVVVTIDIVSACISHRKQTGTVKTKPRFHIKISCCQTQLVISSKGFVHFFLAGGTYLQEVIAGSEACHRDHSTNH